MNAEQLGEYVLPSCFHIWHEIPRRANERCRCDLSYGQYVNRRPRWASDTSVNAAESGRSGGSDG